MHESKNRHVEILDFLTITSELIEIDLLIQNEDHQIVTSEDELKKYLQLKLRNNIFRLINIKSSEIALESEDWYFQKIKEFLPKETLVNENKLREKSVEILRGLDSFRMKQFQSLKKSK